MVFSEDHAEFIRRDGTLTTTLEVLVSGEDDAEVRRVSLTNSGRRTREIELTSYAELVLAPPRPMHAHPAFSKMFVADRVPSRVRRPGRDPPPAVTRRAAVWAAHFAVVEGEVGGGRAVRDRPRPLPRPRRDRRRRSAMERGRPLSNTVGTVLDPVFALRRGSDSRRAQMARVAFWTVVAASRDAALGAHRQAP